MDPEAFGEMKSDIKWIKGSMENFIDGQKAHNRRIGTLEDNHIKTTTSLKVLKLVGSVLAAILGWLGLGNGGH